MVLHKTQFSTLEFIQEHQLLIFTWLEKTANMTNEDYKTESLLYLEGALEHKPVNNITDMRQMNFIIIPELQTWTNEVIFPPILTLGLHKAAIILRDDIFLQVSTEQIMQEEQGAQFMTEYFKEKERAMEWVMSNS